MCGLAGRPHATQPPKQNKKGRPLYWAVLQGFIMPATSRPGVLAVRLTSHWSLVTGHWSLHHADGDPGRHAAARERERMVLRERDEEGGWWSEGGADPGRRPGFSGGTWHTSY